METNANYTIVGAFVIILVSAIVLAVIWLSSGLSTENYITYQVYMKESVSGLSVDAPVEYNGVNVGAVKSIEIDPKNPQIVSLLLSIKGSTPITVGTRAKLSVKSLTTGVASLALEDKGTDMTPLKVKPGQPYPIIYTVPSFLLRLDATITKLNDNIHEVSKSIQNLLDEENLHSIKGILQNLQQVTLTLSNKSNQLSVILDNTAKSSRLLSPLLQDSTHTMQMIQGQTVPAVNQVINNLNELTNNLSDTLTEIKQNPSVLIRGKSQPLPGPGEK